MVRIPRENPDIYSCGEGTSGESRSCPEDSTQALPTLLIVSISEEGKPRRLAMLIYDTTIQYNHFGEFPGQAE
jgi:hypothetical protein